MVPRGRGEDPLSLCPLGPLLCISERWISAVMKELCRTPMIQRIRTPPPLPMGVFIFPTGVPDFDSAGATPGLPRSLGPGWVVCAREQEGFLFHRAARDPRHPAVWASSPSPV